MNQPAMQMMIYLEVDAGGCKSLPHFVNHMIIPANGYYSND